MHNAVDEAAYVSLARTGDLAGRIETAWRHMTDCDLCARYCRVDRMVTTKGAVCRTGDRVFAHSYGPHHGEERPLRGWNGSGTLFFSGRYLRCVFC